MHFTTFDLTTEIPKFFLKGKETDYICARKFFGGVAQLVRACDS